MSEARRVANRIIARSKYSCAYKMLCLHQGGSRRPAVASPLCRLCHSHILANGGWRDRYYYYNSMYLGKLDCPFPADAAIKAHEIRARPTSSGRMRRTRTCTCTVLPVVGKLRVHVGSYAVHKGLLCALLAYLNSGICTVCPCAPPQQCVHPPALAAYTATDSRSSREPLREQSGTTGRPVIL